MKFHPLSEIFPLLEGAAFEQLVADIREHGVREPIWLYEGEILDGRNRYRAAEAASREAPTREYEGKEPLKFVISLNMHRRHLDESQRSMAAAKIAKLQPSMKAAASQEAAVSQSTAAEIMKVGRSSVQRARKVIEQAAPEVARAVERGEMSVKVAADIAAAPKQEQVEAVSQGAAAVKKLRAKVIKPARAAAEQKREKDVAQHQARELADSKEKAVKILRDFIWAIEAKAITPKAIFEAVPLWQIEPKGVLMEFLGKCAKLAAARIKKNAKEQRAWRKKWKRDCIAAKKRLAASKRKAKAKASKSTSKSGKRIRAAKPAKSARRPAQQMRGAKQRRTRYSAKSTSSRGTRRLHHPSSVSV